MDELKDILEGENQLKIVYNCFGLLDNLKTKFNVTLHPLFDLMLVAQSHFKKKVATLNDCINAVLGLNVNIQELPFLKRPISQKDLEEVAKKTACHVAMYHKLVQLEFVSQFQQNLELNSKTSGELHCFLDTTNSSEWLLQIDRPSEAPS